jgi:hypothetical protein
LLQNKKKATRCKTKDIKAIFRNIEQLHNIHCNAKLQLYSQLTKFPLKDDVGAFLMVQV